MSSEAPQEVVAPESSLAGPPQETINAENGTPHSVNEAADAIAPANDKPKRKPKSKRPNYAKIHAKPLPLEVFPMPAFVPHNPLSLVWILKALVVYYFSKATSHPVDKYIGYFSHETRSVHVTDPSHVRALWEMGFFGKGNLSRSEPHWMERETARRKAEASGVSEEVTNARRQERRLFKLERARLEAEMIEEQLRKEGKLAAVETDGDEDAGGLSKEDGELQQSTESTALDQDEQIPTTAAEALALDEDDDLEVDAPLINQEHLQLSLAETFFLVYGLGVLEVFPTPTPDSTATTTPFTSSELLPLCITHTPFPPISISQIRPDAYFLTLYAAYHHYRSLGWVARAGAKFAADLVLYNRGPVFTHAEFSVIIVPEYPEGWEEIHGPKPEGMKWWDLHCVNRVQSQVRKTLVVCYVSVPLTVELGGDVSAVLKSYKVRDFVIRRWLFNRQRD